MCLRHVNTGYYLVTWEGDVGRDGWEESPCGSPGAGSGAWHLLGGRRGKSSSHPIQAPPEANATRDGCSKPNRSGSGNHQLNMESSRSSPERNGVSLVPGGVGEGNRCFSLQPTNRAVGPFLTYNTGM